MCHLYPSVDPAYSPVKKEIHRKLSSGFEQRTLLNDLDSLKSQIFFKDMNKRLVNMNLF